MLEEVRRRELDFAEQAAQRAQVRRGRLTLGSLRGSDVVGARQRTSVVGRVGGSIGAWTALAGLSALASLAVCLAFTCSAVAASWQAQAVPSLSPMTGSLSSVSCSGPGACTAVGTAPDQNGDPVALAERWDGRTWSAQHPPSPGVLDNYPWMTLSGVSCPSAASCFAVGVESFMVDACWSGVVPVIEHWDGVSWAIQVAPTVPPGNYDYTSVVLSGVSCPGVRACLAVGDENGKPLLEWWNGARWSRQHIRGGGPALRSVACASRHECIAVGVNAQLLVLERLGRHGWRIAGRWAFPGSPHSVACAAPNMCVAVGARAGRPVAEAWNGARWRLRSPAPVTGARAAALVVVACAPRSICTAVGRVTDHAGRLRLLTARWRRGRWIELPLSGPIAARAWALSGLACPSAGACNAAGSSAGQILIERWGGTGGWQPQMGAPTLLFLPELLSVSCSAPTSCVAVGGAGAVRWDGTSWSSQALQTPFSEFPSLGLTLVSVSCASASACMAVGSDQGPVAARWDGATWSVQPLPAAVGELYGVSCPTPTSCIAVGDGEAAAWDGSNWTVQNLPQPPASSPGATLEAVSCPSSSRCVAIGSYFENAPVNNLAPFAEYWNGSSWTVQGAPYPSDVSSQQLSALSCPSPTACIAIGGSGAGASWDGNSWTPFSVPGGEAAVSCTSSTACMAVDENAHAATWNGTTWTPLAAAHVPNATSEGLLGVSCSSTAACTAVGYYQSPGGLSGFAERYS